MSINHPRQRQIKLPFTVPRAGLSKSAQTRICGICRKRDSQYTCPRCNIPYCSLECFKAQSHVQCSEPFYKTTVMESISADRDAGIEEKKQMLEMLKRFEETAAEGEDLTGLGGELEEEEEDELERALAGIDLDEIDTNKLFHLLPQQHRDAFLEAIRNPDSDAAKELVESAVKAEQDGEEEVFPDVLPWWEAEDMLDDEGEEGNDEEDEPKVAPLPPMIPHEVVGAISPPQGVGLNLIYNIMAITIAYLHVLLSSRLPSLSLDNLKSGKAEVEDVKKNISTLVPFLIDHKSTIRFTTFTAAWAYVWDKIGETTDPKPDTTALIRLLSVLPTLLHANIIADQLPRIAYAISDCYNLFAHPRPGTAAPRKLAFYLAAMRQLSREEWRRLQREVEKELDKLQRENEPEDFGPTEESTLNFVA